MVIPREVKPLDTLEFCALLKINKEDLDKKLSHALWWYTTHKDNDKYDQVKYHIGSITAIEDLIDWVRDYPNNNLYGDE